MLTRIAASRTAHSYLVQRLGPTFSSINCPCYQAYRRARSEILQNLLYEEYNGLVNVADAVTAIRSRGLHDHMPSNREKIISLLDVRRRSDEIQRLGLPSATCVPGAPTSVDETIQLLKLHRLMIFLFMTTAALLPVRSGWIRQNGEKRFYLFVYPTRRRYASFEAYIDCKSLPTSLAH